MIGWIVVQRLRDGVYAKQPQVLPIPDGWQRVNEVISGNMRIPVLDDHGELNNKLLSLNHPYRLDKE